MSNIYVIYDGVIYTKERVMAELEAEEYDHNFIFANRSFLEEDINKYMSQCSEVWTFGKCEYLNDHRVATNRGADIWRMG